MCRNCGKLSVPAPTCEKCGEQLQEKRTVTRTTKITRTADDALDRFSKAVFVQKDGDSGGALEVLAELGGMILQDDEEGEKVREFLSGVIKRKFGQDVDWKHAWQVQKDLNLQEKRGPKPQGDSKK